jgi:hypothetical protein
MSISRIIIFIFALLAGSFSGCQPAASKVPLESERMTIMTPNQIDVKLEIAADENKATATLTYTNTSSTDAYLDKINGCVNGSIKNHVFRISSEGKEIEYIGILAKRKDPGPDDFVKLPPKGVLMARVNLNEAYEFFSGAHEYKAHYFALHSFPDRPGYSKLKSNEVVFSLTAKTRQDSGASAAANP